jgi:hypothetical protein
VCPARGVGNVLESCSVWVSEVGIGRAGPSPRLVVAGRVGVLKADSGLPSQAWLPLWGARQLGEQTVEFGPVVVVFRKLAVLAGQDVLVEC